MYNKGTIIPGLMIFIVFVTFPLWYNGLNAGTVPPKPDLPVGQKECVAPASEMRDTHMKLLNQWRDAVLRDDDRVNVKVGGKEYQKGLQTACMQCHTDKEKFCDTCHVYVAVQPTCWDCHLTPVEAASKKETH